MTLVSAAELILFTVVAVEQFKTPQDEPIVKSLHASNSLRENKKVLTRISDYAGRSGPPLLAAGSQIIANFKEAKSATMNIFRKKKFFLNHL